MEIIAAWGFWFARIIIIVAVIAVLVLVGRFAGNVGVYLLLAGIPITMALMKVRGAETVFIISGIVAFFWWVGTGRDK